MFSQMTLVQVITYVIGIVLGGGTVAVLLERWMPKWAEWPDWAKSLVIAAVGQVGTAVLAAALAIIPAAYQGMTIEQIVTGLFTAAAAYLLHFLDEWLKAKKNSAQANAVYALKGAVKGP